MKINDFINQFEKIETPILGVRLPTLHIDAENKKEFNLPDNCQNAEFLRALCKKGFKKLNLQKGSKEYNEYAQRIKYELEIINEVNFTDYILLVWDVVNFCLQNDIPVGSGRGSAAGSLVLFVIGVTKIDPIKYNLYFERFISKTRTKKKLINGITYLDGSLLADVDIDFCFYKRKFIIEYLNNKYKGKVSKILTLNSLSSKLLIKEVGKCLGMKLEEEMTRITNLIPKLHGQIKDIDKAYEEVTEFKIWCDNNPLIYETAKKIKDLNKNFGVHPSGMLISFEDLEDCCPTQLTSDKELVSGYDMNWVSSFAVKLDVLGLRNVSVIADCCKSIGIMPENINIHDPIIYQNTFDLKYPHGLFQLETESGFRICRKVKPKNLNELCAIMALNRPGAIQFVDKYSNYTNTGAFESIHPFFDNVLKDTGGLCLYQEQAMKMANEIGFSLDESEQIRRCIGKKKIEEIKTWEKKIEDKVKEKNLPKEIKDIFWKIVEDSGGYQFNKSHSLAYSALCAQTAYLKFKYPNQFFVSLLKMARNEPDSIHQISMIHKEMSAFNIKLLPPNLTQMEFAIEGKDIRFGLASAKGISDKTIEKIKNFKPTFNNRFEIYESAKQAGIDIGTLSALIQAGTLDFVSTNRVLMVYQAQLWNLLKPEEKKYVVLYYKDYNESMSQTIQALVDVKKNDKGKPIIKPSRLETIKKYSVSYRETFEKHKDKTVFVNWWYENEILGYTNNIKLLDIFHKKMESLEPICDILTYPDKTRCDFVGIVDEFIKMGKSKNGNDYAKFLISDESASIQVMIFSDHLEECKNINKGILPVKGDVIICKGTKKEENMLFADEIIVQQNNINTKLAKTTSKGIIKIESL